MYEHPWNYWRNEAQMHKSNSTESHMLHPDIGQVPGFLSEVIKMYVCDMPSPNLRVELDQSWLKSQKAAISCADNM